jgi:hypothetical protein
MSDSRKSTLPSRMFALLVPPLVIKGVGQVILLSIECGFVMDGRSMARGPGCQFENFVYLTNQALLTLTNLGRFPIELVGIK